MPHVAATPDPEEQHVPDKTEYQVDVRDHTGDLVTTDVAEAVRLLAPPGPTTMCEHGCRANPKVEEIQAVCEHGAIPYRARERDWSAEAKVAMADRNHIWINRMSTVRPSDEFLKDLGQVLLDKIRETPMTDDLVGLTPVVYIRVNAS